MQAGTPSDSAEAARERLADELARAGAGGRRLPDFFIVGHAKCGTTALYQMLGAQPGVFLTAVKEPEFLSRAEYLYTHPAVDRRIRPTTVDDYLALFAPAGPGQRAGEASTEYLRTPGTAARIARLAPEARIVAMLREPVAFLRSLHLQLLQLGEESERDFARALELEPERRAGRRIPRGCSWPAALLYSEHVRYVSQLREYREHFGRERLLVLIYDDFRADNAAGVERVLDFLGVAREGLQVEPTRANPTLRVRSRRAERLVNTLAVGRGPVAGAVKGALSAVLPGRLRRGAHRAAVRMVIERDPPAPSPELAAELRSRFRGEVRAAGEYLQRDLLALWGYDGV